jgi:hypothetical protein
MEQRSVTLILRLVLDASGRLQYGEAEDTEAQGRFVGWDGWMCTVRAWLADQGALQWRGWALMVKNPRTMRV